MGKGRLEAFSDGVIAIIITIMVLELKVPHGAQLSALLPLVPVMLSYVLSFGNVGIYWNNHHHMLQAVSRVDGTILWANLHFLFWLSVMPFVTAWMGENHFDTIPVAIYGTVLWMSGFSYFLLSKALTRHHGKDSKLARAVGNSSKEIVSLVIYTVSIPAAFIHPWLACGLFVAVAIMWLLPDRRIENLLAE